MKKIIEILNLHIIKNSLLKAEKEIFNFFLKSNKTVEITAQSFHQGYDCSIRKVKLDFAFLSTEN